MAEGEEEVRQRTRNVMKAIARNQFVYHPPVGGQPLRYDRMRAAFLQLAETIIDLGEPSCELTTAIERLNEANFWANASIARTLPATTAERALKLQAEALRDVEKDKATGSAEVPGMSSPPSPPSPSSA